MYTFLVWLIVLLVTLNGKAYGHPVQQPILLEPISESIIGSIPLLDKVVIIYGLAIIFFATTGFYLAALLDEEPQASPMLAATWLAPTLPSTRLWLNAFDLVKNYFPSLNARGVDAQFNTTALAPIRLPRVIIKLKYNYPIAGAPPAMA